MNDYKDLVEMLREMSRFFVHNEASSMSVPDEMITSMNAEAVKDAADAIEQLVRERDEYRLGNGEEYGRIMMRLIDADELKEKMRRTNRYFDVKFDIDEAPTIDAEPVRHGHWIDAEVIGVDQPTVRCSICGIRFCDLINNHRFMYKYCPHCGAKMDEVSEDD